MKSVSSCFSEPATLHQLKFSRLLELRAKNQLPIATHLVLDVMAYFPFDQHAHARRLQGHACHYFARDFGQEFCRRKTQTPTLRDFFDQLEALASS